jgi:serine/threonine protein kinase
MASPSLSPSSQHAPTDPFVGTDYRALSLIGSGGMGDVFLVEHRRLSKTYAAKVLRPHHASDRRTVDRMRLEADALGKLTHPNIVQIHAFDVTQTGLPFIVMELLKGATLRDVLLEQGRLPVKQSLVLALDLLNGLEAVHQLGIVHRDLKPSNLYVHHQQEGQCLLKLLDFGVARVLPGVSHDAPRPLELPTRTGTAVGTPLFMSPEAALGRPVDQRTDIYAAATLLYLMLTGRGPFDDIAEHTKILEAHATMPPPQPSRFMAEWLPPTLEQAILRGLAKEPGERFQTAADFAHTLYEQLIEYDRLQKSGSLPTASANSNAAPARQPATAVATHSPANVQRWALSLLVLVLTMVIGIVSIRLALR